MKEKFRGEIPLPDFWGGYRVVPPLIEFWQGRKADFMIALSMGGNLKRSGSYVVLPLEPPQVLPFPQVTPPHLR